MKKLKDCFPGEKIKMDHVDDVLIVLEAGEGVEENIKNNSLIPVVSIETWKVCLEQSEYYVFCLKNDE